MTNLLRTLRTTAFTLTLVGLVFVGTGCDDDNPAAPGDDTEHADLEGLVVETSTGTEILRLWEGEITGSLTLPVGATMSELEIWFLDDDGDEIRPGHDDHDHSALARSEGDDHDHDEEYSMAFMVEDSGVATMAMHGDEEWAVDLTGVAAGTTTVQFMVMHGDHADFTSLALPIVVEAPAK